MISKFIIDLFKQDFYIVFLSKNLEFWEWFGRKWKSG